MRSYQRRPIRRTLRPVSHNHPIVTLRVWSKTADPSALAFSAFFLNHSGRPGHIIIHPPNLTLNIPARIVFTTVGNVSAKDNYPIDPEASEADQGKKGKLTISINDLCEIRKHGIGWQSRMFVNWAIGLEVSLLPVRSFCGAQMADSLAPLLSSAVPQGVGGTGLELKVRRKKTVEVDVVVDDGSSEVTNETTTRQDDHLESFKFGAIVRRDELFNRLVALGDQRWEVL